MDGNNHVSKKADHAGNGCRFYSGRVSACSVWVRRTHGLIIGQHCRRDYWHLDCYKSFPCSIKKKGRKHLDWKELIGFVGGFLTTMGMVPQVWRLFKLKSAHEISLTFSLFFNIGVAFWLVYGILQWVDVCHHLEWHSIGSGLRNVLCQDEVGPIGHKVTRLPTPPSLPYFQYRSCSLGKPGDQGFNINVTVFPRT